jgi:acetylornithine deacetylase/succinyl-diaminopimelate desuccinylase-like protein
VQILASARDFVGKITIPGFYDDVKVMSTEDRKQVSWDFNRDEYHKSFGAHATGGEKAFSPMERNWIRPTLEVNGITGGYSGSGFKTVIPAKASAKVSCRLVPNQNPKKIGELVAEFFRSHAPEGVQVNVNVHAGAGQAVSADVKSPAAKAFADAYSEVFKTPCQFVYSGASIPVVPELSAACGGDVVLVGLGLSEDCIHAPNEHFGLNRLEIGFLTIARALQNLRRIS